MLKRWTWLVLILVALMGFVGCSDDDDNPTTPPPPADTAFEVMAKAGGAYVNGGGCPGTISAEKLDTDLTDYTVIDLRQKVHYDAGHITGAVHSSLATLLTDLATTIPKGNSYVVVCYTGQSAGHAKIAMELMGYEDTYTLSFGMCAWNSTLSKKWNDNTGANGNQLAVAEKTNNNGDLTVHTYPTLTEDVGTVVADRVKAVLTGGFKGVMYDDIKNDLGDYFVLNYFGEADYLGTGTAGVPGHIPGAFQFTPAQSLGLGQMLDNLPSDGTPIVVYCWTSQTSSQVTAYLNMLGYSAKSLSYGSNNLFYDKLIPAKRWVTPTIDLPLEKTP